MLGAALALAAILARGLTSWFEKHARFPEVTWSIMNPAPLYRTIYGIFTK